MKASRAACDEQQLHDNNRGLITRLGRTVAIFHDRSGSAVMTNSILLHTTFLATGRLVLPQLKPPHHILYSIFAHPLDAKKNDFVTPNLNQSLTIPVCLEIFLLFLSLHQPSPGMRSILFYFSYRWSRGVLPHLQNGTARNISSIAASAETIRAPIKRANRRFADPILSGQPTCQYTVRQQGSPSQIQQWCL